MAEPILEVRDLTKRYGGTVALDRVSFSVNEGEIFGLLGPNGAGKTTLLSIVAGLLEAGGGEVRIQGRSALPLGKELRKQIGIVPQELALYNDLSAAENLGFFGRLYGIQGAALKQQVEEVLTAIGLTDRADQKVNTFSGGMKRRLNLGAALVHQPRLLFLDEPTTGVDPQSRNHIFEEIRRLNRAGTTVVYTSHYMEEVQILCPRVGILDHGRIIACDQVPVLLRQMAGMIRFRLAHLNSRLPERLSQMAGIRWRQFDNQLLELECEDVKGTLLRLVALLNELNLELIHLETQEPNLEGVFLHLTGRGLRD
ncbi:MAG TPA: ABC transporter ATP-binding protein [Gemmataceae bacterium]|nr:ABC transporter ATP-binding protein [Gemmataceae bacterium]